MTARTYLSVTKLSFAVAEGGGLCSRSGRHSLFSLSFRMQFGKFQYSRTRYVLRTVTERVLFGNANVKKYFHFEDELATIFLLLPTKFATSFHERLRRDDNRIDFLGNFSRHVRFCPEFIFLVEFVSSLRGHPERTYCSLTPRPYSRFMLGILVGTHLRRDNERLYTPH